VDVNVGPSYQITMHDARLDSLPEVYAPLSEGATLLKRTQPARQEEFEALLAEMDTLSFQVAGALAEGRTVKPMLDRMDELYHTMIAAGEAMIPLEKGELSRQPPARDVGPSQHGWPS
jgi:hypothetical protein